MSSETLSTAVKVPNFLVTLSILMNGVAAASSHGNRSATGFSCKFTGSPSAARRAGRVARETRRVGSLRVAYRTSRVRRRPTRRPVGRHPLHAACGRAAEGGRTPAFECSGPGPCLDVAPSPRFGALQLLGERLLGPQPL